jgi:hypothetical protein
MGRRCSTDGEEVECIKILVRKPRGKRPPENLNVAGRRILIEIGWGGTGWIHMAQDRPVEDDNELLGSVKSWGFFE